MKSAVDGSLLSTFKVFPNINVDTATSHTSTFNFWEYMHSFLLSVLKCTLIESADICGISRGILVRGKVLSSICLQPLLVCIFSLTAIAVITANKVHRIVSRRRRALLQTKLKQLSRSLSRPRWIISATTISTLPKNCIFSMRKPREKKKLNN